VCGGCLLALCSWFGACGDSGKPTGSNPPQKPPTFTRLDALAGQPGASGWVDGSLVAAHFADPWSLTGDGQGHLYVSDGDAIRAIDQTAGTVTTLAGVYNQLGTTDGVGAQASLNLPSGLAFLGGTLYLADTENHTIRKIDVQTGSVTTVAGLAGQPGAVDGTGTEARFREPEGLALDASGNLYIGDTDNNLLRKLVISSAAVASIAGSPIMAGSSDGVGAAALFNKPRAMTIDGAGNLFVADSVNQSIRMVEPTTGTVSTIATFDTWPQGLAVDGTDVLASLADNRIVRVAADGTVTTLAGSSGAQGFLDGPGDAARFNSPAGLWNDGAGTLYVVDNLNAVIRAIVLASASVSTYAGAKSLGSADGIGGEARFSAPQGLAADETVVYVADTGNDVIRKIVLATGEVTTPGGAVGQPGHTDGALADARFNQPRGLAFDVAAQQLYVADTLNHCIRRIDLGARTVSTLTYATAPGATFNGLDAPSGVALDQGRLFVTDSSDNVVVAIDLQRAQISTLAGQYLVPARADGIGAAAGFYGPLGIAADGHGNLYVADDNNETIRKIEIASAAVSTIAGQAGIPGSSDGIGSAAHFHYPAGLAVDGVGDVFVADSFNNIVRHVEASSSTVTTAIGTLNGSGVRLGPLPAQLTQPSALALTSSGALLIVSENAVLIAH
jgi:sugar lactone lactonase YvrE